MRFTVFGATGGTGQQLVRQALEEGAEVTAVVRDPARLPLRHARLEVVTAELTGPDVLRPAVAGRDAVLSGLGSPTNKGAGIASRGTRAIVGAMEAEGVARFLAVSAAPLGPTPEGESLFFRTVLNPLVKRALRGVYADLAVMEEVIAASGLDWTVVRPPQLTDGAGTGRYQRVLDGNVLGSHKITRADLAHAMLTMRDDPETVRRAVGVAA
ncbi:SDR family oxidoreductase [Streptomyces sp. HNM0574]|uniref:NAD(P)-dependent oxidoreductase n=1 Tax=Streptomyces sp. HNM0574 TaxID=2714954 RepID=UPI00146F5890|nr:SDR family oxidoreductase [Streptomyces sp. HNM0574]NLU66966.1 SDR family oxidoreductase [Streptomyces sp. HNM0574]